MFADHGIGRGPSVAHSPQARGQEKLSRHSLYPFRCDLSLHQLSRVRPAIPACAGGRQALLSAEESPLPVVAQGPEEVQTHQRQMEARGQRSQSSPALNQSWWSP